MIAKAGALIIFLIVLAACEPISDDAQAPRIDLFELAEDTLTPGDALEIAVVVSDNEELNQMRLRVSDAFSKNFGIWTSVRVDDISGTSFQTTQAFLVPDSALAGLYQVAFQVVDQRGNASMDSIQFFTIFQPGITPIFSGLTTEPSANADFIIQADTSGFLRFLGEVEDEVGLELIEIEFIRSNGNTLIMDSYSYSDTLVTNWSFTSNVDTFFFQEFSSNPVSVVVRAINTEGHQARRAFQFDFGL